MKHTAWYLAIAFIATGFFSFTAYTDKGSQPNEVVKESSLKNGDMKYFYNSNGSIKQILFKKDASTAISKNFVYNNNKVTITELLNGQVLKQEIATIESGMIITLQGSIFNIPGKISTSYSLSYKYNCSGQIDRIIYGSGAYHQYDYDKEGNIIKTKWYNERGEIISASVKQYFPALPDEFISYARAPENNYRSFFPPFKNNPIANDNMNAAEVKEISFDGKYGYTADLDGYILKGKYDKEAGNS